MTADLLFFLFAASRLLLLTLLRLVVRLDNVCTSYDVFSGDALNDYSNNWCLSLRGFFPHSVSKSGTFPGTALTGDRSPKTGTVPGNRGRLVTLSGTPGSVSPKQIQGLGETLDLQAYNHAPLLLSARAYSVIPPPRDAEEREMLHRVLRVDHAGEYGANRIYAGQMAVLGRSRTGPLIQEMWDQEKKHLAKFNEIMAENRVRPTALLPLWNVAGFVLGASTALLGKEGAMACTVAVEESISEHYNSQIRALMEEDPERYTELLKVIKEFRDDELEHHDTGLEHDAESLPGFWLLKNAIQLGCKAAIYVSQRV